MIFRITLFVLLVALAGCSTVEVAPFFQPHQIISVKIENADPLESVRIEKYLQDARIKFYNQRYGMITFRGNYVSGVLKYDKSSNIATLNLPLIGNVGLHAVEKTGFEKGKPIISLSGTTNAGITINLDLKYDASYEDEHYDQLDPARNKWRIKPEIAESDVKLKARVADQLAYISDYFKLLEQRGDDYYDGISLNAPVDFYADGLGLKQPQYREKWNSMFYDSTNAVTAYGFVEDALYSVQIAQIKEQTPIGRYNNILAQMTAYFKNDSVATR